jgi:hypothetical protein
MSRVPSADKLVAAMRTSQQNVAFNDLYGDPRVNIQNDKGKAYQVRQVLEAIDKKEAM